MIGGYMNWIYKHNSSLKIDNKLEVFDENLNTPPGGTTRWIGFNQ